MDDDGDDADGDDDLIMVVMMMVVMMTMMMCMGTNNEEAQSIHHSLDASGAIKRQLTGTPRPPHVRHLGGIVFVFACRFIGSAALAAAAPLGDVGVEYDDIRKPEHFLFKPMPIQFNPNQTQRKPKQN